MRLRKALRTIVDTVLFSRGLQHARAGPGLPVTQNWATTDQISGETSLQSEMELGGSSGKLWVLGGELGWSAMERWWYCSFEHFCLWSLGGIIITKRFGGGRREAEPLKDPMTQETRPLSCSQTSTLVPSLASLEMGGRILSWVVLMPAGRGMMVTEQKS